MKLTLNIIICFLLFVIWADIERNSLAPKPDYSNSILSLLILIPFIILRIFSTDFKKYLLTRK